MPPRSTAEGAWSGSSCSRPGPPLPAQLRPGSLISWPHPYGRAPPCHVLTSVDVHRGGYSRRVARLLRYALPTLALAWLFALAAAGAGSGAGGPAVLPAVVLPAVLLAA